MRDTQLPVGNICFQPEASIHTYGALPTALHSKTYSGVYQLKYEMTKAWEKRSRHDASLPAKGARE